MYRLQSLSYVCMFKVWHPDPRNLYGIHSVNYIGATYLPDICTCNGARIHIVCFKTCLAAVSCKGTKCHRMLCVVLVCHSVETLLYSHNTTHASLAPPAFHLHSISIKSLTSSCHNNDFMYAAIRLNWLETISYYRQCWVSGLCDMKILVQYTSI